MFMNAEHFMTVVSRDTVRMINHPEWWPHSVLLPVVNRRRPVTDYGVIFRHVQADQNRIVVYRGNMLVVVHLMREGLGNTIDRFTFPDAETCHADGWEVD